LSLAALEAFDQASSFTGFAGSAASFGPVSLGLSGGVQIPRRASDAAGVGEGVGAVDIWTGVAGGSLEAGAPHPEPTKKRPARLRFTIARPLIGTLVNPMKYSHSCPAKSRSSRFWVGGGWFAASDRSTSP
jgi:hypothetical protein